MTNSNLKEKFLKDLDEVYALILQRDRELYRFYSLLDSEDASSDREILVLLLQKLGLEINKENLLAAINRVALLQESSLESVLKKRGASEEEIDRSKEIAYKITREYHQKLHKNLLSEINKRELLTPFYRELLVGFDRIGVLFGDFFMEWNSKIVIKNSRFLERRYQNDTKAILGFIKSSLLKYNIEELEERSYYLFDDIENSSSIKTYYEAFDSVKKIVRSLDESILYLKYLDDEIFGAKDAILVYLKTLRNAFENSEVCASISLWRNVDRAWMSIDIPIQIAHPLEYYEDKYLKAVAPEWDVRVVDSSYVDSCEIKDSIKNLLVGLGDELKIDKNLCSFIENALNSTKLYISLPGFYYGANFNGLFSAQVVPNDERVSKERGKKIFAYPSRILQASQHKPFMKIDRLTFDETILKKSREVLFRNPALWLKLYEISTIGHEFGHILWVDERSEIEMNRGGVFKNIEEFKATSGGVAAYLLGESCELLDYLVLDLVKRAVKLIAWMENLEVEAYYCEALIHLNILFESKILQKNEKLSIDMNYLDNFKALFLKRYKELVLCYANKLCASEFLDRFVIREEKRYMPRDDKLYRFVDEYHLMYKDIGQVVDDVDSNKNWLIDS